MIQLIYQYHNQELKLASHYVEIDEAVEILLNKLANGDTDLSDCEPIQSRYEFLLSYLIKNGGIGGDIEYITYKIIDAFETLYTTAEKPVKSLKLSGNTLVNCVLEDTENDDLKFLRAVKNACLDLKGSFALEVISSLYPDNMIVVRQDSPLVIGKGENENYI